VSGFHDQLILASAGTGKTFRLTSQFLALLFAGVEPDRILATTFTRKAAGEILDRVLERLVDAADSARGLAELRSSLGEAELSAERCRALLVQLTRNLDTFQVRTIDSFFVHLIRLFALDLELPPAWSISDEREAAQLESETMQDVLEHGSTAELLELLRDLQKGGASRGVQTTLLRRIRELRPIALESAEGAWSVLRRDTDVDEDVFQRARAALPNAPLAKTAKGADYANWVKARDGLLAALEAGSWREVLAKGLGAASLTEDPTYYKKPLEPELLEVLAPLVARAKAEELNQLVARNEALHRLLERFEESFALRKREAGLYRFEDLPQALAPRTARARLFDEREAELWFRLDGRIDHLLLDEFQDTSPVQWRILQPLASEITSSGGGERSFFCVGDVKQSIYGFRQAEPRLLASLETRLPGLVAEHMDKSYRSSSVVLDGVNLVFGSLVGSPAFEGDELAPYRDAAEAWAPSFDAHQAAKELPGIVHVVEARQPGDEESTGRALLARARERVQLICSEAPEAEVGVLVRRNKFIPLLIHDLREHGIDASGEGGSPLTDSEAVLVFVSLLHLADHPGDRAAAFHVKTSRFAGYLGLAKDADEAALRECARRVRVELASRGLGEVTAELARHVQADPGWSDWDRARFAQLADEANAFEERLSLRGSEFVDHLRTNRVQSPGGSRVRVMTVHASKGLEFDAVILAELDGKLVGQRDGFLIDRPDPAGLIEAVMLSPGKELLSLSPELERLYHSTTTRHAVDGLCNLYVGMTRARRRLELIVPWLDPDEDTSGKAPTYAGLVRAAIPPDELCSENPAGVLWSASGNAQPQAWGEGLAPAAEPGSESELELVLAASGAPRSARRRSASAQEGGGKLAAADLFRKRTGAEIGTLVHAAFEGCEWIEDFGFDARELERHGAGEEVIEAARGIIERALQADEIRRALSRDGCSAPAGVQLRVEREHEFSLFLEDPEGSARFWNGAVDRLVLGEQDGRVVWAEVLDYKTDRVEAGQLEAKAEHYRPQLEAYARVVAAQTGLAPSQVRLRLAFLSPGRVVDL